MLDPGPERQNRSVLRDCLSIQRVSHSLGGLTKQEAAEVKPRVMQGCWNQWGAAESPQPHAVHPSPAPGQGTALRVQSSHGTCCKR